MYHENHRDPQPHAGECGDRQQVDVATEHCIRAGTACELAQHTTHVTQFAAQPVEPQGDLIRNGAKRIGRDAREHDDLADIGTAADGVHHVAVEARNAAVPPVSVGQKRENLPGAGRGSLRVIAHVCGGGCE